MSIRVEGVENCLDNLNVEINRIRGRTVAGLLAGGLKIQRESQRRVPVEYGDLKRSAYTRKMPENDQAVEVGYSAAYAIYVHENLEMKLRGEPRPSGLGEYWGPNGQSKFLETAAIDLSDEVVRLVAAYARSVS